MGPAWDEVGEGGSRNEVGEWDEVGEWGDWRVGPGNEVREWGLGTRLENGGGGGEWPEPEVLIGSGAWELGSINHITAIKPIHKASVYS